jgi:hypothetical protein
VLVWRFLPGQPLLLEQSNGVEVAPITADGGWMSEVSSTIDGHENGSLFDASGHMNVIRRTYLRENQRLANQDTRVHTASVKYCISENLVLEI